MRSVYIFLNKFLKQNKNRVAGGLVYFFLIQSAGLDNKNRNIIVS